MSEVYCHKHSLKPEDERWKVLMEEMTTTEDENREPFGGQVCPACFISLRERLREAKRNLKVESRQAIALRAENDYIRKVLDSVILTVKELSGKDANDLANQVYQKFPSIPSLVEQGCLENILPNLIVELANRGKKC